MSTGLRVAFEQFDETSWTGGQIYIQNLLKALRSIGQTDRLFTILAVGKDARPCSTEADLLVETHSDPMTSLPRRIFNRILRDLGHATPVRHGMAETMKECRADALFTWRIYRCKVGVPLVGWIPDFQYLHLPQMYKPDEMQKVRKYHQDVIDQSSALLVSSKDVLKDLAEFSPEAARTAHVVPFVAQIPPGIYDSNPGNVCENYNIPERFFYLPNQFWKHKNHLLVLDALKILADRQVEVCVVCTGSTSDWRNPAFFASLLTDIACRGVHDCIRILGLVPRSDVYDLHRQSLALLQPSLFEGWSTSIEEAKSVGKQVVASDLPVHREQIPDAIFFDPTNAESLANALEQVAQATASGPDLSREAAARRDFPHRELEFSERFNKVIQQALGK